MAEKQTVTITRTRTVSEEVPVLFTTKLGANMYGVIMNPDDSEQYRVVNLDNLNEYVGDNNTRRVLSKYIDHLRIREGETVSRWMYNVDDVPMSSADLPYLVRISVRKRSDGRLCIVPKAFRGTDGHWYVFFRGGSYARLLSTVYAYCSLNCSEGPAPYPGVD